MITQSEFKGFQDRYLPSSCAFYAESYILTPTRASFRPDMTTEETCRRKFSQFVPNHIFRDVDRYMATAIMNGYSMTNELRENC